MLAKRASDDVDGELLARGYWQVLGSKLTEKQMGDLTELVLERCKWFPTVAECNEIMGEASYANPFYVSRRHDQLDRLGYAPAIDAPAKQITDETDGAT